MEKAQRVLVYRLGSLGDTVVALPLLHLVERAYPGAERRMLTNLPVHAKAPAAAAVLHGSGLIHGYFHYPVGLRHPLQLLKLWWQIRRWRPEVLVYAAASRGVAVARRDARFFRLCGIRTLIGVPLTEAMQQNAERHGEWEPEAERLVRNAAELGGLDLNSAAAWDLHLTPAERHRAEQVMSAASGPAIAVSIGTKVQSKDWGAENWQALLTQLALRYPGYALWLIGAAEERAASEAAAAAWPAGWVVNLCGELTPRESAAVLARARLFVGLDSGPMHLAAAVQTPCVAIFAARNLPRVWFPYGAQHRVLYHEVSCMGCGLEVCVVERKRCLLSIPPEEVVAAITQALQ